MKKEYSIIKLIPNSKQPINRIYSIKNCCNILEEQLEDENRDMIDLLDVIPFDGTPSKPQLYFCSDGGHGGMLEVYYCPNCGTKIEIEKLE